MGISGVLWKRTVHVHDRQVGAAVHERLTHYEAEAACSAGNDCGAAFEGECGQRSLEMWACEHFLSA